MLTKWGEWSKFIFQCGTGPTAKNRQQQKVSSNLEVKHSCVYREHEKIHRIMQFDNHSRIVFARCKRFSVAIAERRKLKAI
jgi:hypothetical protein